MAANSRTEVMLFSLTQSIQNLGSEVAGLKDVMQKPTVKRKKVRVSLHR